MRSSIFPCIWYYYRWRLRQQVTICHSALYRKMSITNTPWYSNVPHWKAGARLDTTSSQKRTLPPEIEERSTHLMANDSSDRDEQEIAACLLFNHLSRSPLAPSLVRSRGLVRATSFLSYSVFTKGFPVGLKESDIPLRITLMKVL